MEVSFLSVILEKQMLFPSSLLENKLQNQTQKIHHKTYNKPMMQTDIT